ncbi:MAG: Holliday junction resolvase RuvX [Flavobacteriaceae bacterium]|nr:MAG: Holliday junction resolvase RuvX [Flavobacteriaceae bacterium]
MKRALAIDYGAKRTGVAITDPERIIASGLTTLETSELNSYLDKLFLEEQIDTLVVGLPKDLDNQNNKIEQKIVQFTQGFQKKHPEVQIIRVDERFTSKMAFQTMIDAGIGKKARKNKALVDQISATLILQSFLEQQNFNLL